MRSFLVAIFMAVPVSSMADPSDADAGAATEFDGGVTQPDEVVQLRMRVAQLEQRSVATEDAVRVQLGALDTLRSASGGLSVLGAKVSLTGFLQSDVQWRQSSEEQLDSATGAPLNDTRFLIRRARLKTQIDARVVRAAIEADFNTVQGPAARLLTAEVAAGYTLNGASAPLIEGSIGQFKIPFGFETLQSDRERLFMERSNVIRALFPGEYDLGAQARGEWRFVRYAVAVMNGHPEGDKQLPDRAPIAPRDLVARIGVDASITTGVRVEAGASALAGAGFHAGTSASKDQIVWRDTNGDNLAQGSELQVIPGLPAQASSTFGRQAFGADLHVTLDVLSLGQTQAMAELIWSKNLDRGLMPSDPLGLGRDLRGLGWHVGVSQHLTKWAIVGLRYDRYNPDLDALDSRAGVVLPKDQAFATLSVTAGFVYAPFVRVLLEYDHNTNPLGRDTQGVPTTLVDDAVIARAEVAF